VNFRVQIIFNFNCFENFAEKMFILIGDQIYYVDFHNILILILVFRFGVKCLIYVVKFRS
jgi:hypothetical protein